MFLKIHAFNISYHGKQEKKSLFFLPVAVSKCLLFSEEFFTILLVKIFFRRTDAVAWRCSVKKMFYVSRKIHQKTSASESFLSVKLQDRNLYLCWKETLAQVFYCEFCKIFKNTYRTSTNVEVTCMKIFIIWNFW